MSVTTWLALALVCLLGAMSPGPSLAVVVRTTLGASRRHGIYAALAHACGVGLYALASVLGLALLLQAHTSLYRMMTWAGAGYLMWLGLQSWRAGVPILCASATASALPARQAARDGLAISLLNPKLAIFFIALFSQFIRPQVGWPGRLVMVLTAVGIDACWYVLVTLLLTQSGILAWLRQHAAWLNRGMGTLLLLLGLRIFLT
jgi:threonine/homoserine/homoserine lactone efflux protein